MRNATNELRSLPEYAFQKCFQQWKEWWPKCVHFLFSGLRSDTFWTGWYVNT
jgi:hypothetical protein